MSDHSMAVSQPPTQVPGTITPCYVFESNQDLAQHVARTIAGIIRERNGYGQQAVLGLPTGSTPLGVYRELIRMHKDEGLDFSNVITFNLDEYFGLGPDQIQSYNRWMYQQFFNEVNVPEENINIPDGTVALDDVEADCRDYEQRIEDAGGIDVLLLGVGRNGHIGFNEPFSSADKRTRLVTLDPLTRKDAASDFFSEENVPTQAITMGIGTILDARKILLIALGEHKASIVHEAAEAPMHKRVPASILQQHNDAAILLDGAAANGLTGWATPWVLSDIKWTDAMIKRAVLWLCEQAGKALLKLDDGDYRKHNLHWLLRHHGPGQKLAHKVFQWMMETIHYHPGGRRPKKRIICFSPHPDDDVISMGGTLIRLLEDGHEVHVAYMTSGNIAVFDHDARRIADLVTEYNKRFGIDIEKSQSVESTVNESLDGKQPGDVDIKTVLDIKELIRWSEAKVAAIAAGCREENLHFLDLPFYKTGAIEKKPITDLDVKVIREKIEGIEPDQIYLAGDLSDPHGTHRMCARAIFRAILESEEDGSERPDVLMYRGAWQEYDLHEIEIAVPLSPADMVLKRTCIFMHESQKDSALFPGPDTREFWQRAEDRNTGTADKYNEIGLPEYFAMEAFVRWNGVPI